MTEAKTLAQVWARQYLLDQGITLQQPEEEIIISSPWSELVRFHTDIGTLYLKTTPEHLALEAPIIQTLQTVFGVSVPTILGFDTTLHCFLMKDAGVTLRSILKKNFNTAIACQGINRVTQWQMLIANELSPLLNLGVPDWRLENIALVFQEFLLDQNFWDLIQIDAALHHQLILIVPTIESVCEQLSHYHIPQSFVQPDCNDNNLLLDPITRKVTLSDVGELVISHPLLSVVSYLYQLERHHKITKSSSTYVAIRHAALEAFLSGETEDGLIEALSVVTQLWPVYDALSQYRLIKACGSKLLADPYRVKIVNALQSVINDLTGN